MMVRYWSSCSKLVSMFAAVAVLRNYMLGNIAEYGHAARPPTYDSIAQSPSDHI